MTARDSSAPSTPQRICPKCGQANSNISLFCAECGAVLNGAMDEDRGSGGYSLPSFNKDAGVSMSAANDDQSTQPIRTTTAEQDWASMMADSGDDAGATAPLPRLTPPTSTVTSPEVAPSPSYEPASVPATWAAQPAPIDANADVMTPSVSFGTKEERHQSMRGFWFGIVGFLLILVVLGLYGWSILPEGGFRDTVQGWF